MAFSGAQETSLKSTRQKCVCRFVSFPVYNVLSRTSFTDGNYTFLDMVNIYPRHGWVACDGTLVLDATESIQRGGAAATNHVFSLEAGSGSINDNGDGTCDYTAPSSGTGTATIKCVTDGNTQDNYAYVAYGEQCVNVGQVTGFHADIGTGGWEMTLRAMGDATGLERQKGILVCVDDYWNGSESTFGGYEWADGVFYGYVDRVFRIHQDSDLVYLEVTVVSPGNLLDRAQTCDLYFVKSDTAENNIVIADFKVMDAIWYLLQEHNFNHRHNVWIFADSNSPANLKLSEGPVFDVVRDIAQRTFCATFNRKLGALWVIPDPDIRGDDWFNALAADFAVTEDFYEMVDLEMESIGDPTDDPPSPPDPTFHQVRLVAVQNDLDELTSEYPAAITATGGKVAEVTGLICETQATLDAWAIQYYYKIQPESKGTYTFFLMHHFDLYTTVSHTVTIRADLTNTDFAALGTAYVTGIDYDIDPGTGSWHGSVQWVSQALQP